MQNKLRFIQSTDEISFSHNYEVLNACFGASMKSDYQRAIWYPRDGAVVWFPHIAKIKDGKYVAGSSEVNWKNYFDEDGNVIVMMLYPGEYVNDENKEPEIRDVVPMYTFMKMDDHDYRYVGSFMLDKNNSTPRRQIVRKIKDRLDLSVWADGYDTTYFDTASIGKDVFKELYISHNFKKQRDYVDNFLNNYNCDDEEKFEAVRQSFINSYGLQFLLKTDSETYNNIFLKELANILNTFFKENYSGELLRNRLGELYEFGSSLRNLLYDSEVSVNDKIRNNQWGSLLTSEIYTLFDDKAEEYLYTLDEISVDRMIQSLGIKVEDDLDLTERQSRLYFWRYCDDIIADWSIYKYYRFLCFISDLSRKSIPYIQLPKPDVRKRIITEENKYEEELSADSFDTDTFDLSPIEEPRLREINVNAKPSQGCLVPRNAEIKKRALARANYCCEIDKAHPTFVRRNSDKNYTEPHHLIPLEYSAQFKYTLDTGANIVSLCSNCHNQIHYGKDAEKLIIKLFEERKEALKVAKIDETENGIKVDITQLLHMYGLD